MGDPTGSPQPKTNPIVPGNKARWLRGPWGPAPHLVFGQELWQVFLARLTQHCEVAPVNDVDGSTLCTRLTHQVPGKGAAHITQHTAKHDTLTCVLQ